MKVEFPMRGAHEHLKLEERVPLSERLNLGHWVLVAMLAVAILVLLSTVIGAII